MGGWHAWDPASGHSSPGAPAFRLTTTALRSAPGPQYFSGRAVWLAYDSADASFWVAAPPGSVDVVPVSGIRNYSANVSGVFAVGSSPFGVAIDNASDTVFVTNTGSDNVSLLSGVNGVSRGSIAVGAAPHGIAFDPTNGEAYVANTNSSNVTVVSESKHTSVANLTVGSKPVGVVYDPATRLVFVANSGGSNVTVINATMNRVVASIRVGNQPYGLALDNRTDTIYVSNNGSKNLSVIDTTRLSVAVSIKVNGTIPLEGLAYDSRTREVWVGGGYNDLVIVNTTNESVAAYVSIDPSGVAYDPDAGWMCTTNTLNGTFECLDPSNPIGTPYYAVTFTESGAASGSFWGVALTGGGNPSSSSGAGNPIIFYVTNGSYTYTASDGSNATVQRGSFLVRGTAVSVTVAFATSSVTYEVSFAERGLPNGTRWAVNLSGTGSANGTGAWENFTRPNGTYQFLVAPLTGFTAAPSRGNVTVQGSRIAVPITFNATGGGPGSNRSYQLTFHERGLKASTGWAVTIGSSLSSSLTSNVTFLEPNGTYGYVVLSVSGYQTPDSGIVRVNGTNVTVDVAFAASTYPVVIVEFGLPNGTNWSVTVTNASTGFNETKSTNGSAIVFFLPNGTYTFTFHAKGYTSTSSNVGFTVDGNEVRGTTSARFGGSGAPVGSHAKSAPWFGFLPPGVVGWFPGILAAGLLLSGTAIGVVYRRARLRRAGDDLIERMRMLEGPDPPFQRP
ncbi:MAG TPA: YncE family protein [Thermoplasmata archaeon]|nr:YncE family protein [Thermoplasmata archaeon]